MTDDEWSDLVKATSARARRARVTWCAESRHWVVTEDGFPHQHGATGTLDPAFASWIEAMQHAMYR